MSDTPQPRYPSPEQLAALPALERVEYRVPEELWQHGVTAVVHELKLETPQARYYLCVEGMLAPRPAWPLNFVKGAVTPVLLQPDGTWKTDEAYDGSTVGLRRKTAYWYSLFSEQIDLKYQQQSEAFSWETARRLDEVSREMDAIFPGSSTWGDGPPKSGKPPA